MSHSPINRRDALLAGAGLAIAATASTSASAQMPPQSTTASAILILKASFRSSARR